MVKSRQATSEDFAELGDRMRKTGPAIAIEHDGRLAAVAGHYLHDGNVVLFSTIAPWARSVPGFARYVLRFGRQLLREAAAHELGVFAWADDSVPKAPELLQHMGFVRVNQEIYQWAQRD